MDSLDGVNEAEAEAIIRMKGAAKGVNPFLTPTRVIEDFIGKGEGPQQVPTEARSPEHGKTTEGKKHGD